MSRSKRLLVKAVMGLISVCLYTYCFIQYDFLLFKKVTVIVAALGLAVYSAYKFFKRYAFIYSEYMSNKKTMVLNKKVDKPRIFIYSIAWPLMILFIGVFSYASPSGNIWIDMSSFSLLQGAIIVVFILINFTWSPSFENRYMPKVMQGNKLENEREFKTAFSVIDLSAIFDRLTKFGFIIYEDNDEQIKARAEFVAIFRSGQLPDQPKFKLEFKNPDTAYFMEKIQSNTTSLTSVRFVKIFTNLNGIIKPESLSSSSSQAKKRSNGSRNMLKLDSLFEEIG